MSTENGISRRRALQAFGAAGVMGIGLMAGCTKQESGTEVSGTTEPAAPKNVELEVYDPTGAIEITHLFTPRLDTLAGKTIAFISDDSWEDRRMFADIRPLLESMYEGISFIHEDEFIHGIGAITVANNGIPEVAKSKGADAAIVGNAG